MNKKLVLIAVGLFAVLTAAFYGLKNTESPLGSTAQTNNDPNSVIAASPNQSRHTDQKNGSVSVVSNSELKAAEPLARNNRYIAVCEKPAKQEDLITERYFEKEALELVYNIEKFLPLIEQSNDMASGIAHALITINNDTSELSDKFKQLNDQYPGNALLSYDLLSSCTSSASQCERSIIEKGVALDNQNGAVWLLSALYELSNNNLDGAIESLTEAANASVYKEYWGEHYNVFETAFAQAGAHNDLPTQLLIMKYNSTIPLPNFGPLAKFCKNTELSRMDILEACLGVGLQLTSGKGTMLSHAIGLGLQEAVYQKYSDQTQIADIASMKGSFDTTWKLSRKANALTWQSSQRTSDWLQEIRNTGEMSATEYIVDESIRLSADPNFDPCEVNW